MPVESSSSLWSIDLSAHDHHVGAVQRAQRSLASDVVGRMRDRLGVPEVSTTTGQHQRQQTRVPTAGTLDGTVISVGRRTEKRNYDGYGLTTVAHVAVSAEGGKSESTLTLQANGQALIQSDQDSAYVVSKGPAVLASAAVANVVGSGGVTLIAGGAVNVENAAISGARPAAPGALSGHADLVAQIADAAKSWADANADAIAARDTTQGDLDPDAAAEWAATQRSVALADRAKQTFADRNALGRADVTQAGALGLYAEGGVIIGTTAWAAIHAQNALTISAASPAIVATDSFDVSATNDARTTAGRDAALYAKRKLRVVAHEGDVHVASRTGQKVEVQAAALHLGQLAPDAPQTETDLVSVRAKRRVSIATDKDPARDEGAAGVFVATHEVIDAKADKTVLLQGAQTVTLKIADKNIDIVIDPAGAITIKAEQSTLEIDKSAGLVFRKGGDLIKASPQSVFTGLDAGNKLEIRSSGVELKGSRITIG